jgi:hypothetical protein
VQSWSEHECMYTHWNRIIIRSIDRLFIIFFIHLYILYWFLFSSFYEMKMNFLAPAAKHVYWKNVFHLLLFILSCLAFMLEDLFKRRTNVHFYWCTACNEIFMRCFEMRSYYLLKLKLKLISEISWHRISFKNT